MSTEPLERAAEATRSMLATVDTAKLSDPTPCESWDVKALVNHIVGGMHFFNATASGESPSGETDFTGIDFVASYADAAKQLIAKLGEPGAMEATYTMPFGPMPGSAFVGLATLDTFQHAWDLAKATGQSTDIDADLAAQLLENAKASISDNFRGPEGAPFGLAVEVPPSAPAADQLAGFLGREV